MSVPTHCQPVTVIVALAIAVSAGALAGCGGPAPVGEPTAATATSTASTSASAPTPSSATSASRTPGPTTAMGQLCGRPDVEAKKEVLAGPGGEQLVTFSVGSGPTVALLLHQTGRGASCGWWPYANRMAASGVRAVMLDLCGYGASTCDANRPWYRDYPAQVALAAARLRADGAQRLTIVGASLGGTVASLSAAPAKADAVVNLSGFGYETMVTGPALAGLTIPVLGAGGHDEGSESAQLEREVAASASPTKRFVWAERGHGWNLVLEGPQPDSAVSPLGRVVIGWVKGDYAAT